jgi:hypothetical protein
MDEMSPPDRQEPIKSKRGGKRKGAGRPKGSTKLKHSEELVSQIRGLGEIQCTRREAAAVLGVNEDTFSDFLRLHTDCFEAFEYGREEGCVSLRRTQLKMAESNASMAIWCGKQYLNQSDKSDNTNTHRGLDNIATTIKVIGVPSGNRDQDS